MDVFFLMLYLLAGVCFGLAASKEPRRYNFLALGLLLWVLVDIIKAATHL